MHPGQIKITQMYQNYTNKCWNSFNLFNNLQSLVELQDEI